MEKQSFGTYIAAKRKQLGMTQADLAEKMNVTDKAVSKWERDLSYPDVATLPKLAEIFNVTVDELLREGQATPPKDNSPKKLFALICKAIMLAMGVAVATLSLLGEIDAENAILLLGIGLAAGGIASLQNVSQ